MDAQLDATAVVGAETDGTAAVEPVADSAAYPAFHFDYEHKQPAALVVSTARTIPSLAKSVADADNFTRWAAWSPDAATLATVSNDRTVRFWSSAALLSSATPAPPASTIASHFTCAESVYDLAWYPYASDLAAVSMPHQPIHLLSAATGQPAATYVAFDHLDQVAGPTSLAFCPRTGHLLAGFTGWLQRIDPSRSGRVENGARIATTPTRRSRLGQKGILSSIAHIPEYAGYAVASYRRTLGVYDAATDTCAHLVRGLPPATHLAAHAHLLVSSHREAGGLVAAHDVRNLARPLWTYERGDGTNMRSSVTVTPAGDVVMAAAGPGGREVHVTDAATGARRGKVVGVADDLVACCAVRDAWWATTAGQRHYRDPTAAAEEDAEAVERDNALRVWQVQGEYRAVGGD
ncbi:hypothetical protein H9P43_001841 [Blastocladiella emersonii ATCC 22665]|nr:hypothetical protein H9P43_001841 [Blastocladiella emersonii ATCC 22665]